MHFHKEKGGIPMATQYGGYMGKILQIYLTTEIATEYSFTDQQCRETPERKTPGLPYSFQRID